MSIDQVDESIVNFIDSEVVRLKAEIAAYLDRRGRIVGAPKETSPRWDLIEEKKQTKGNNQPGIIKPGGPTEIVIKTIDQSPLGLYTSGDLVRAAKKLGFDIDQYKDPYGVLANCAKRLARQGKITRGVKEGKTAFGRK